MPETPVATAHNERPQIEVWLTADEAAEMLGLSLDIVCARIECGQLETRITDDGTQEILIPFSQRTTEPTAPAKAEIVSDALPMVQSELLPMVEALRWSQSQELRRARRGGRLGWVMAASVALGAGTFITGGARETGAAREQVRDLSNRLEQLTAAAQAASAERERLRGELVSANRAADRADGELAVERKVEDTLFKAALTTKAQLQANSPVLADGGQ